MGKKGAKLTTKSTSAAENIVASLKTLGDISSKKMFGGYGIFEDNTMFALVNSEGSVFFKADDASKVKYEQMGSHKHGKMPYFNIPDRILNDDTELLKWAEESIKRSKLKKK